MTVTYTQTISEPRLLDLAKEAGQVYSQAIVFFHRAWRKKHLWLSEKSVARWVQSQVPRQRLHSQSYQAAYQQLFKNLSAWRKAKQVYLENPAKFTDMPKMPRKRKFLQPIQWKKNGIIRKGERLLLSLVQGQTPIVIRWNQTLPTPLWVTISWDQFKGWQLHCIFDKQESQAVLDNAKVMGIDLGVKRLAATFDGKTCITYSGKYVMSLIQLRNKVLADTKQKQAKLIKHSRHYRKIQRAYRKVSLRIQNKIKDVLHKYSRYIVSSAVKAQIKHITIGDCSGTHVQTNCGKENNQKIQQNPEMRLAKYIQEKHERVGGSVATDNEAYTTQDCPACGHRYKPKGRLYHCRPCGFTYDRDGSGSLNIWGKKVSFQQKRDVVGRLTRPRGITFAPQLSCA
jgi:putative transposase